MTGLGVDVSWISGRLSANTWDTFVAITFSPKHNVNIQTAAALVGFERTSPSRNGTEDALKFFRRLRLMARALKPEMRSRPYLDTGTGFHVV